MIGVSASVNLLLHHKVQKFSSGTGSPGWSRKKGRKTVVVLVNQGHPENIVETPMAVVVVLSEVKRSSWCERAGV